MPPDHPYMTAPVAGDHEARPMAHRSAFNSLGIAKAPADTRVVVAMSGGVDSSVTAALLVEQGYEVIGITLQLYDYGAARSRPRACCAGEDVYDARAVAELHRAADAARDQSYFLFTTTTAQLDLLRFPLGGMESKSATRELAERFGLAVAEKPDSQDICFVPDGDYAAVIDKLRPDAALPGDIVDLGGAVLGRHDGISRYTIGQRRGLGVGGGDALYVVRLEPESRRVVVGPRAALAKTRVALYGVNWLGAGALAAAGFACAVKLRPAQAPVAATVHGGPEGTAEVVLDEPEHGVAPGQACVFYDGERVMGGGWIRGAD